jgi:hypothetical protein
VAQQSRDRQSGEAATQLAAQPGPRAGVERGQRLVEQQQPGVGHQDARQRHALGLSARKRLWSSAQLLRQAESRKALPRLLSGLMTRQPPSAQPERDVVERRQVWEPRVVLKHGPDATEQA